MKSFVKNIKNLAFLALLTMTMGACEMSSTDMREASPMDNSANTGKAGSMARFAISGNRLYVVDDDEIRHFSLQDPAKPTYVDKMSLQDGVETIFPYGDKLFLGTTRGMLIFDVSNFGNPTFISNYVHVTACDPVVVQDNFAYVTLRNAQSCRQSPNQLDIVSIDNLSNPQNVNRMPMQNPHGLGVEGDFLFICEGDFGLKAFHIKERSRPVLTQAITGFNAYDLIPNNGILMVVGKDGFLQYSYDINSPENPDLRLLSKIVKGS